MFYLHLIYAPQLKREQAVIAKPSKEVEHESATLWETEILRRALEKEINFG